MRVSIPIRDLMNLNPYTDNQAIGAVQYVSIPIRDLMNLNLSGNKSAAILSAFQSLLGI